MEDEDFGEDVLVTTQRVGGGVKEEAKTEESRATWEVETVKKEAEKVEEDEDEELYGGVSIQLNASATSQAEAAAASAAAGNGVKTSADPAADSEDDEDDEDVAIVLSTAHAGGKPTLRFTGGGNRFVRGSFGGPQHGATGATGAGAAPGSHQPGEHGDSTGDGVDDMAMFGGRRTAFDVDIDLLEDRPWRKPGVDISDYFNYGFDEHTWREYAARQLRLRRDLAMEKSREQASRQAVNAANQQAMRERDAKMQGRGFPGQIKPEGDEQNGAGVGAPPRGGPGGFMGPPPRGWHPGMGPPPGFMGQQNWNGPPMGGAPWGSGPGRGPPWMGGPGGGRGRGGGRGGFDERGRGGKDDRDDRRHDLGSAKVAAELQ
ncbi:hypothetical protein KRP22_005068 [Phytophthora ramorum]|uniref:Pre-mRNA polyadenylation factor fip1 n=1 Tax=Phytophthora ramorum TaxID=164328 RepID=UPI0030A303FF|nr:Pre-mRNA polyadenylation factor fip1 [Phytophthora ramorum]KAH7497590.1 Pre-mRNA polyadenylation factor fip1 [Phytophthora ramorum]